LREGQDLPLDKNGEIADMKVHVRQNQEDLETLRLDMNRQEYLHQVLNDNVEKQNKTLNSELEKNTEQLKTMESELKSELVKNTEQLKIMESELKSELKDLGSVFRDQTNLAMEKIEANYQDMKNMKKDQFNKSMENLDELQLEIIKSLTCSINGHYFDLESGSCYRYEVLFTLKNWKDSQNVCVAKSGVLVNVHSREEWAFIKERLRNVHNEHSQITHVWLGGSDQEKQGKWVWTDGSPVTYADWNGSGPDGRGCISAHTDFNYWQWIVRDCTINIFAVCKILV